MSTLSALRPRSVSWLVRVVMAQLICLGLGTFAACGGPGGDATSTSTTTGTGSTDPGACLIAGNNCGVDADCEMGSRCNHEVDPPQCEKLYCGAVGTLCSDESVCTQGLACDETWESAWSLCCVAGGDPCAHDDDCCSTEGVHATCQDGACKQACTKEGEDCSSNTCCDGFKCDESSSTCSACGATGAACTEAGGCCNQADSCVNGTCTTLCAEVSSDCGAGCCPGLVCDKEFNLCQHAPAPPCNPVKDTQCDVAGGELCTYSNSGFTCDKYDPPPPQVGLCQNCDSAFCKDGNVCLPSTAGGSQCMHYCCTNADCGGGECRPASASSPVAYAADVGVCALYFGGDSLQPICSGIPATAPSKGTCHTLGK